MRRFLIASLCLIGFDVALWVFLWSRPGRIAIYLWIFGPMLLRIVTVVVAGTSLACAATKRLFGASVVTTFLCLGISGVFLWKFFDIYPSSHDNWPSRVSFRLPFDGPISVQQGGATPAVNYHVAFPDQRWAYDLAIRENGLLHRTAGDSVEDYFCYGVPILAPASGVIVAAHDGEPDAGIRQGRFSRTLAGNHVVILVAPGEFLFMGHMKPGSVIVHQGDHVSPGQQIGRVGNSGRSSYPHLHLHLQDSQEIGKGEGIPLGFHHYSLDGQFIDSGIPTGGERRQIVCNVNPKTFSSTN